MNLNPFNREPKPFCLTHLVKAGDTLSEIAEHYTGDWGNYRRIADENRISNPDLIFTGQKLTISGIPVERFTKLVKPENAHLPQTLPAIDDSDIEVDLLQ